MVICKCLQIWALNQKDDKSLIINLLEQEELDCCDLMEKCYGSKTGENKFPSKVLVMCLGLVSDFNHCSEGKHITLCEVGYLSLCSWKTFWGKEGICKVRQSATSFKPGQIATLHHGVPTLSGLRSFFIKKGSFGSPWAIWSTYLKKACLETGQPCGATAGTHTCCYKC